MIRSLITFLRRSKEGDGLRICIDGGSRHWRFTANGGSIQALDHDNGMVDLDIRESEIMMPDFVKATHAHVVCIEDWRWVVVNPDLDIWETKVTCLVMLHEAVRAITLLDGRIIPDITQATIWRL